MQPRSLLVPLAALLTAASAACGHDDTSPQAKAVIDPGDGGRYAPQIDPTSFVDVVDNPYLPLLAGSRWVYEGTTGGDVERVEVTVTGEHKTVMAIDAIVVRDSVYVDGALVEDTFDWFAQDGEGDVWYLGEDSIEYEDGDAFRQEPLPGVEHKQYAPGVGKIAERKVAGGDGAVMLVEFAVPS